ncbi:small serum protein 5-like [Elgaria multicarinata webbii]|uniref:small serum protein 5-like n=1 Tax=Elgaria multicarinata webbii TaxID=159646 RepID=UPI002FCD39E6
MKAFLILTAFCITLGLCHGACTHQLPRAQLVDGVLVAPDYCVDSSDGSRHPIGSLWDSAHCWRCSCGKGGMNCCTRYGGIHHMEGCTGIVDMETCDYVFYRNDDPTKPC